MRTLLLLLCLLAQSAFSQPSSRNATVGTFNRAPVIIGGGGSGTFSPIVSGVTNHASQSIITLNTTGANAIFANSAWFSGADTLTDNEGNTYTKLNAYSGNGSSYSNQWFVCYNATTGSGHTFTNTATINVFTVLAVHLSSGTPSPDAQTGFTHTSGNLSSQQPGSLTPTVNNDIMLLGVCCNDNGGGAATNMTVDSGYTIIGQSKQGGNLLYGFSAYLIETTATAQNPTVTFAHGVNALGMTHDAIKPQ